MQVYNKEEVQNYFLVEEAKNLYANKFITKEQLSDVIRALLTVKTNNNLLLRIAFFLLGSFLYSSIAGAFAVITLTGDSIDSYKILLFLYTAVGLIGSELLARKNYFRHGLDDAFILGFQLCFCIAFGTITEEPLVGFMAMIVVGAFCSIRYIHTLSILVFCIGIVAVFCDLVIEQELIPSLYLPFIGFLLAVLFYFGAKKVQESKILSFYAEIVNLMKLLGLLLGYFSMNYMVVRELSQNLMDLQIVTGEDIPFAFLFYGFTFIIPAFYIIYALHKKERLFLWVGLFVFGYSIFTIRYYYSLLPLEYAMLLGGSILFVLSFVCIRYWKDKTEGITFQPDRSNDNKLLNAAQVIIMTTQVQKPVQPVQDKMPFGGGDFSGGGAGEKF